MNKKQKKLLIFTLLIFFSMVVVALGLKYFPFTRVMKMPAGSEKEFANPKKSLQLPPHNLYFDFEVPAGKEVPGGFYKGLAHSGRYSVKAFGQNSFSFAIERTAGEVGVENLKAVALSAWIYVFPTKNEAKGNFVFTASNELGVNVCWQGIALHEPEVPKGKWFKISGYFDLGAVKFKPGYKLQVYFWNNSRTDILIDDYNIVFGGTPERRGDSTRVDMTKPAGYVARFNMPPFPVTLLEKGSTGTLPGAAETGPGDQVVAGNFLNTGNDALFIIRKDGRCLAYACCPSNGGFSKVTLGNAAILAWLNPVQKILRGKFIAGEGEQLIITGEKGWILAAIDFKGNPCTSRDGIQANIKILSRSDTPESSLYAGDFNADRRSEILTIASNGSWRVQSFEQAANAAGKWKVIAADDKQPVAEWNRAEREVSVSAGRFLARSSCDQVLTVSKGKEDKQCSWTIFKLNIPHLKWESCFGAKQGFCGKTVGKDSLKLTDRFYTFNTGDEREPRILRYNRDWRFDLEELRMNDSTFEIRSSVDFHGFELDHNPKYYESLLLVPGNFTGSQSNSFFVSGHIARERHYEAILPDFSDIYSFPGKK